MGEDKLKLVTYCGLYCGLCAARGRIPRQASKLKDAMTKEGYDQWGKDFLPGFEGFWEFLGNLCDPEKNCPGCRQGGGPPFCGIRKCAQKRGVDVCPFCDEFPCDKVKMIAKGYTLLIPGGERMKEIGIDAWIAEQEQRAKTGFAYSDIRCHPYDIPRE